MSYKEKTFQSRILTPWMKKNGFTMAYEAKVSAGNTVSFSKFKPHQLPALRKAKHGILHHKFSDSAIGYLPCDGVCLNRVKAYIIILFEKEKTPRKKFYMIDIDEVLKIKKAGGRSIKKKHCQLYGITVNI